MGDDVVGVRVNSRRGWRVVHTNIAFWLTRYMPVGHEKRRGVGGKRKLRWKERGKRSHQSGVVSIYNRGRGEIRAQQPAPLARSWRSRWTRSVQGSLG